MSFDERAPDFLLDGTVPPFGRSIQLRTVGRTHGLNNTLTVTERLEISREVLTPVIRPKLSNFDVWTALNFGNKLFKALKRFRLVMDWKTSGVF